LPAIRQAIGGLDWPSYDGAAATKPLTPLAIATEDMFAAAPASGGGS
jgi:hypothetical protein